jgi:beta-glucosidase
MTTDSALSLEQAASLLSGADMESTASLPEHGIPSFVMTDGSNGVARNLPNFAGKVSATCYPTLSAMGATWDADLTRRVGRAIALDARAAGAGALLAPGMNLKRSPLGGRNFEYFSEDALLTSELASGFVTGVQSVGVAACAKHFAVNNQETDRMRVSADVDERALREVYLRAFERVVRTARPSLVMASYNRINGVYATENSWLLTSVLREEWGFDGVVVSDWGAVDDRVAALAAGLDLEMPSTSGASNQLVVDAVNAGLLDEAAVHAAASRVARLAARVSAAPEAAPLTAADADALALEAAERAAVLLRNEGDALPLRRGASVAVVGSFASSPRFQGGGSAGVNAAQTPESIVDLLRGEHTGEVTFSLGYDATGVDTSPELLEEAARAAALADVAVVFVGLPEDAESEGFDRTHLNLPAAQEEVIAAVAASAGVTVVVLIAGGVVCLERWREDVQAILLPGLAGQATSRALTRILTGATSPSGRLAETIPLALEDSPSHPTFPGERGQSVYGESIFVGYRGYDEQRREVAFPFGHGLTYTSFEYASPRVVADGDGWVCEISVRNVGAASARDIVQVYASAPRNSARRAHLELVGFDSVELGPGESATARVSVPRERIARWDIDAGWVVDGGDYTFHFSRSSRDHVADVAVTVESPTPSPALTIDSTMAEWVEHPLAGPSLLSRVAELDKVGNTIGLLSDPTARLMIGNIPMKRLTVDAGNVLTQDLLIEIAASLP